ncbi:uncharacterized protein LOC144549401 [Carex rostrata]
MTFRGFPKRPGSHRNFFGVIFIHSCKKDFIIFDAEALDPPQINSKGHLTLTSLRHSIPVEDDIVIFPWFIDPNLCTMHVRQEIFWQAKSDDMNQFICRTILCPYSNYLDVSFAVYNDAVEAHLDIYFVDFENIIEEDDLIKVHGTVSASNSFLSNSMAKSFLFHKLSEECVSLKPGELVPLPLSRRITTIPRQSTLFVHVSIDVSNVLVIDETVKFNFNPSLDSTEEFIILPNHGKVLVKVSWVDCQTLDEEGNDHLSIEDDVAPQEANFMDTLAG